MDVNRAMASGQAAINIPIPYLSKRQDRFWPCPARAYRAGLLLRDVQVQLFRFQLKQRACSCPGAWAPCACAGCAGAISRHISTIVVDHSSAGLPVPAVRCSCSVNRDLAWAVMEPCVSAWPKDKMASLAGSSQAAEAWVDRTREPTRAPSCPMLRHAAVVARDSHAPCILRHWLKPRVRPRSSSEAQIRGTRVNWEDVAAQPAWCETWFSCSAAPRTGGHAQSHRQKPQAD